MWTPTPEYNELLLTLEDYYRTEEPNSKLFRAGVLHLKISQLDIVDKVLPPYPLSVGKTVRVRGRFTPSIIYVSMRYLDYFDLCL